ncbi:hypothetical protein [Streptomyces sp. NPDC127038]|uniref:hypothetical protein n=1 Tax=Streptomyces sp. NPDC127038 TaxID=3347114 RepID=UPI003662710F
MPSVAMYANNAYLRELRRNAPPSAEPPPRTRGRSPGEVPRTATAAEAMTDAQNSIMARDREQFQRVRALWERPASGRRDSLASSTGGGFAFPGENEMSDGLAFEGARRARYAPSVDSSRNPGQDQLSDAIGFQAAREASLARVTALPLGRTPAPVHEAEQAHHDGNDTAFDAPGREPLSDGHAFLAAGTAPLSGSPPPLPHALPSPMTPVSPLASPTVAATGEPRPLLSDAGRLAARDSISSTHTASTSRDAASPARSTPVATPVRTGQNTNATTPKARRV